MLFVPLSSHSVGQVLSLSIILMCCPLAKLCTALTGVGGADRKCRMFSECSALELVRFLLAFLHDCLVKLYIHPPSYRL